MSVKGGDGAGNRDGSGGRIALLDYSGALPAGISYSLDGRGNGGVGTLFTRQESTGGELVVDALGASVAATPIDVNEDFEIDGVTVRGNAQVCSPNDAIAVITELDSASFTELDDGCEAE